jgi:ParB/RepB/Spo0J family partition protein
MVIVVEKENSSKTVMLCIDDIVEPLVKLHLKEPNGLFVNSVRDGLVTPIIVSQLPNGKYRLVAGWRRLRAYQLLGRVSIPAIVKQYASEEEELLDVVTDNTAREDCDIFLLADAVKQLQKNFTQEEIAKRLGVSQQLVSMYAKVSEIEGALRDKLRSTNMGISKIYLLWVNRDVLGNRIYDEAWLKWASEQTRDSLTHYINTIREIQQRPTSTPTVSEVQEKPQVVDVGKTLPAKIETPEPRFPTPEKPTQQGIQIAEDKFSIAEGLAKEIFNGIVMSLDNAYKKLNGDGEAFSYLMYMLFKLMIKNFSIEKELIDDLYNEISKSKGVGE